MANQLRAPIRATFYYPWFPETWGSGATFPNTIYTPSISYYPTNLGTIQAHIAMMRYARFKAAIASWWGPGTPYDTRMHDCLKAAEGTKFKWAMYYEREGYENPNSQSLAADLDYAWDQYAQHPNFLRVGNKPVMFVYADPSDGATMALRWKTANAGRFHVCLKVFPGYDVANNQPESWHQYAPANNVQDLAPWSFTVSPGFAKPGEPVRLERDLERFRIDVRAMDASPAMWHLVTCFNEWGEGTAVEPELGWGTTYLDVLAGTR